MDQAPIQFQGPQGPGACPQLGKLILSHFFDFLVHIPSPKSTPISFGELFFSRSLSEHTESCVPPERVKKGTARACVGDSGLPVQVNPPRIQGIQSDSIVEAAGDDMMLVTWQA
jgi:hypothetical protein